MKKYIYILIIFITVSCFRDKKNTYVTRLCCDGYESGLSLENVFIENNCFFIRFCDEDFSIINYRLKLISLDRDEKVFDIVMGELKVCGNVEKKGIPIISFTKKTENDESLLNGKYSLSIGNDEQCGEIEFIMRNGNSKIVKRKCVKSCNQ